MITRARVRGVAEAVVAAVLSPVFRAMEQFDDALELATPLDGTFDLDG